MKNNQKLKMLASMFSVTTIKEKIRNEMYQIQKLEDLQYLNELELERMGINPFAEIRYSQRNLNLWQQVLEFKENGQSNLA